MTYAVRRVCLSESVERKCYRAAKALRGVNAGPRCLCWCLSLRQPCCTCRDHTCWTEAVPSESQETISPSREMEPGPTSGEAEGGGSAESTPQGRQEA